MNGLEGGSGRAADYGPRSRKPEDATSQPERFARSVLDGLSAHVAVLDEAGTIVAASGGAAPLARLDVDGLAGD